MPLKSEMVASGVQSHRAQGILGTIATGLAAAGVSSQANSTALTSAVNKVDTVAATTAGVRLPQASLHDEVIVRNNQGTNSMLVYPPTGGKINGGSTNASVTHAVNTTLTYKCVSEDGLQWQSF